MENTNNDENKSKKNVTFKRNQIPNLSILLSVPYRPVTLLYLD